MITAPNSHRATNGGLNPVKIGQEEEEKKGAAGDSSSLQLDLSSEVVQQKPPRLDKPTCLLILKQIISIKREQAFCQMADKEIFMTNDKSVGMSR